MKANTSSLTPPSSKGGASSLIAVPFEAPLALRPCCFSKAANSRMNHKKKYNYNF